MDASSTSDYVSDSNDSQNFEKKSQPYRHWIFPGGFKQELKCILEIYVPCVLTNLFRFLNPAISMIMCGSLSKLEFDASSLANSVIYIFGSTIDMGFATAFDTLFAQIYGSEHRKKMGVLLQRAIIIMTLVYLLLACFHLNMEPILILLKQDILVAELTTRYITIYLPGLFFDFQFLTISRYLQNQGILYPTMVSALISNIFNAVSQYVAISRYGCGLDCSAFLQAMSCFVMCALQLGYILITRRCKDTWDGFSLKGALNDWKIIFALGIPGIMMILLEEASFEFTTIIAGTIDMVQLGAQSIALEIASLSLISTFGLEIAVTMRIGRYLGSRDINRVKTCIRMSAVIAIGISVISFFVIFFLRRNITKIFTNDLEIQNEGTDLLVYISVLQFVDIIAGITSGTIKACGRQHLGTCVMFVCYYIIGLPVGCVLAFVFQMKIKGIWIGLIMGLFIETVLFTVAIQRTDWEVECDKALANAESFEDCDSVFLFADDETEETPLICKSDVEGERLEMRESLYYNGAKYRRESQRKTQSLCEYNMVTFTQRRRLLSFVPETIYRKSRQPFKKILKIRIITIVVVMSLFLGCLLMRIYVPKSWFIDCIPKNNDSVRIYDSNFPRFCDYNLVNNTSVHV